MRGTTLERGEQARPGHTEDHSAAHVLGTRDLPFSAHARLCVLQTDRTFLKGRAASKPSCTVFRFGCGSPHRARIFMSHFFPEHKTKVGARLSRRLGIVTSWMTILRRVMSMPGETSAMVTALGIDDFSFRRGRKFGTILVDLSAHQIVDLLPERKVESAAAWMRSHPEIQYVSRDRGQDYAQAACEGAPQAIQCADRFHLTQNLVETIEPVVARCYKEIRKALAPLPEGRLPKVKEWRQAQSPAHEQQRLTRLATNQERYRSEEH